MALDTASLGAGDLLVTIIPKVAEMEHRKTMERVTAGRVRVIAGSVHTGCKLSVDHNKVKELRASGLSISKTAEKLGTNVATVIPVQAK